jgi:hypothetical protein
LGPAVTTFPDPYPLSRRCRAAHLCDLGRGATLLCNTAAARPENTSIEKRLSVPERHLGGLAEFERELIRARTGEGRQRARARGVHLGRKPKLTPHQKREALALLMADVEIVATYELYNIDRIKLENLIHRIFDAARLDIEIKDRFGQPVIPREWFLVPLFVVNEAVDRIKDGTITGYVYDLKAAALVRVGRT